jgi:hypothetical protein
MPSVPYFNVFSNVSYPILDSSDLLKGGARIGYESCRGRPLRTSIGHGVSQVVSSAIGRSVDMQDDRIGIDMLQGQNGIVKAVSVGIVSGGIDMAMGRGGGSKVERFIVPFVVDVAVDTLASKLTTGNPRIL